ncbi:oxidoreductaseshort chain dehydrogenase/reductase family protein [Aphelenchoides avenae]|nr:oxidoreductaseshort chain dehydrogenase/reductase family protein [Aphelenchus avenae]
MNGQGFDNLKPHGARMKPFILDVGSDESVKKAHDFVAGTIKEERTGEQCRHGRFGFDDWLKVEDYAFCWNINALGMIRVTHAFKHLIKKSR